MTALLDSESIPLTNAAFRDWMTAAGVELKRLGKKRDELQVQYFHTGDIDAETFDFKFELMGWKYAISATYSLWKQLRSEMD